MIKKKSVIILLFFSQLSVFVGAQNLPYIDDNFFHLGFLLGSNSMDFGITPTYTAIDGKTYTADVSTLSPGFTVGIISDMRLNRYLNLRVTPTLNISQRELVYRELGVSSASSSSFVLTSIPVCVPVLIKYSAERYGNYRPYILAGGGAYVDLGRNKDKPVLLKPFDVYAEVGVGCDLYFSFFKLAPELKFAIGGTNMFTPLDQRDAGLISESDKKYSIALSKLTSKMLTLAFNFE